MKKYLFSLILVAMLAAGCSDDSDSIVGSIVLDNKGLFVAEGGGSAITTFTQSNITYIEVDAQPDDWTIEVSLENCTITAYAPSSATAGDSELVFISGYTDGDYVVRKSLYVGVKEFVSLESEQSNSMMVHKADRVYTFNPRRKGELLTEDLPAPDKCEIVWRSANLPIQYVHLNQDGMMSFYVTPDEDDLDEDGSEIDVIEGNALIYAQASDGSAIWSWHIWVCEDEVTEVTIGDVTYMDRNLGASINDNSTTDNIALSYGLYYQWGRKDPFIYPGSYNGAGGVDADQTDHSEYTYEQVYMDCDSEVGTVSYATSYPWRYIIGSTQDNYDWVWSGGDADLWGGVSNEKSVYDPCPMGWELPTSDMLSALYVDADQSLTSESYGATLSGGNLFMGLGFRTYITGRLQNINSDYEPWKGYYWSRDASSVYAKSMQLEWLEASGTTLTMADSYRSNGMQIRCVRQQ
ncbi:MAG: FISUMP domain-containing protein [Rikenellaceae bacterium]